LKCPHQFIAGLQSLGAAFADCLAHQDRLDALLQLFDVIDLVLVNAVLQNSPHTLHMIDVI